jgi:hypothetical protein
VVFSTMSCSDLETGFMIRGFIVIGWGTQTERLSR